MKERMEKATCFDMLEILTMDFDKWKTGKEIVKELKKLNLTTNTRAIAEFSKELRAQGYRVVSNKASCFGYCITNNREKIAHFYRMQQSHIDALEFELKRTFDILTSFDDEYPTLPIQR